MLFLMEMKTKYINNLEKNKIRFFSKLMSYNLINVDTKIPLK